MHEDRRKDMEMTKQKKQFMGAGMSRRVFALNATKCVKVPVEGREDAAVLQNFAERDNLFLAV